MRSRSNKWFWAAAVLLLLAFVSGKANADPDPDPEADPDPNPEPRGRGGSRAGKNRDGKLLSIFQIVRFPNDPCVGNGGKNGTCYTAAECAARGGSNGGQCANQFGVCCTFTVNCGATANENCTYFESTGSETGGCSVQICKCNPNVCQLRLDFDQFMITGPSTSTQSTGKINNGVPTGVTASGIGVTPASQCLTDTFSVSSGGGGGGPPTICGINSGEHMYVDASNCCNDLNFQLGSTGKGTTVAARQWSIKVTQLGCDHPALAPDGCTQYHFGPSGTGTIQSFNFAGGQHLANQEQRICIRRERGQCRICYTTIMDTDFAVSGMTASAKGTVKMPSACCGYGTDGMITLGADCLSIPGANSVKTTTKRGPSRFCGRSKGLVSKSDSMTPQTICSDRTPFQVNFLSDTFEFEDAMEAKKADIGFRLVYMQTSQMC